MSTPEQTDQDVIDILHITDCHLSKDKSGDLLGVNTRESLEAVLTLLEQQGATPDHVLVTGDIAQDASVEAYQFFKQRMSSFNCPVSWFPGNHDKRDAMRAAVAGGNELQKLIELGKWQIVMLDSLVEGKVHGWLEEDELAVLDKALSSSPEKHNLVCLHHHPVDIECTWLDKIGLHNRDAFLNIIDKYSNVRGVLWGHIHQEFYQQRGDVDFFASPSTCIQFLPRSKGFAVDNIAPGYRWLKLQPDGTIETEVVRAEEYSFELDMQSTGY